MKLPDFDRKVRVAMDRFLDLFLKADIVQLKTDKAVEFGREHFEADEVIVPQGRCGRSALRRRGR